MQYLIGKTVQFTSKIDDMESYLEGGMRARIVSIDEEDTHRPDLHDHLYKIVFDYSEFDEFNKNFESANYYDRNGVACLTAREAGMYDQKDTIYFGSPELWPFEDFFILLSEKQTKLISSFKESGATNYIEWLEGQVDLE